MSKKILCLTLAIFMIFSISLPVFAVIEAPQSFNMVALGDSVPAFYGVKEAEGYMAVLDTTLNSLKINSSVKNLAVSGSTTTDLLALLDKAPAVTALETANVVTLNIGGNNILVPYIKYMQEQNASFDKIDISALTPELITKMIPASLPKAQKDVIMAGITKFKTDMPSILAKIHELAPNAKLFINTVYNPVAENNPIYSLINPYIAQINKVIKDSAKYGDYTVVDVYAAFAKKSDVTNFNLELGSIDIHPNVAGHLLIASTYAKALSEIYYLPALTNNALTKLDTDVDAAIKAVKAEAETKKAEFEALLKAAVDAKAAETTPAAEDKAEETPVVAPTEEETPVVAPAEETTDSAKTATSNTHTKAYASRAQAMLILNQVYALLGISTENLEETEQFSDLPTASATSKAIMTAKNLGIVTGSTDGKFNPDNALTKQDLAIIVSRVIALTKYTFAEIAEDDMITIADIDKAASYAKEAITALVNAGILKIDNKGNFNPQENILAEDLVKLPYTLKNILVK